LWSKYNSITLPAGTFGMKLIPTLEARKGVHDEAGETGKSLCAWLALERIAFSPVPEVAAVVFPFSI
jgi:hypothetical protein